MSRLRFTPRRAVHTLAAWIFLSLFPVRGEKLQEADGLAFSPLSLSGRTHDLTFTKQGNGSYRILTSGSDPYVYLDGFVENHNPATPYVLAFECQVPGDFDVFTFYYRTEQGMKRLHSKVRSGENWAWQVLDLSRDGEGLGTEIKSFRIDFGDLENQTFTIRNLRLIQANRALRLRATLGGKRLQTDRLGIGIEGLAKQTAAVETLRYEDQRSVSVTLASYRHLDLDAETKRGADQPNERPPVRLAPRIVAGEGPHSSNHTVVRILSPHQVCETQFLAYPPEIRGGVGVEAGKDAKGRGFFATWPLSSSRTNTIRIFNRAGGEIGGIRVAREMKPPFDLCVGDFSPSRPGDELAVISGKVETPSPMVLLYSPSGEILRRISFPGEPGRYSLLTQGLNRLLVQEPERKRLHQLLPEAKTFPLDLGTADCQLFDSVYPDRDFNSGQPEQVKSTLGLIDSGKRIESQNLGRMENLFWFDPQDEHGGDSATWGEFPDGTYVKNGLYNYLGSAQYWSPLVKSGEIENRSYQEWVEGIDWPKISRAPSWRKSVLDYNRGIPTVWSAGFSHRWSIRRMKPISSKINPGSGLPEYLLLDHKNDPVGGGYFGETLFDYGTQHFESEALNKLYTYAQRAFYRKLAPAYRSNPEMTIAVEPNHENEIVSGTDSIGDYNPGNLTGFFHYLRALYGELESINRIMKTNFTGAFFDAPRNLLRGDWDKYDFENRFFREWVEYNRVLVSRRVGTSYRECLLAGFPPEMIKCHQIPDSYVFDSIIGISEGKKRLSPIDWLLTTGAGFGFSRYGTYFERERNVGQGAHSSGFDNMLIGEYASLNASHEKSLQQLLYLRNHGVSALHVMWWPSHLDKGYNQAQESALREMISKHDQPRKGLAGGISEIRPWRGKAQSFDVAGLGTEGRHTGLIKSFTQEGSFEGTVYSVPFHAHVGIHLLNERDELTVSSRGTEIATIATTRPGCLVEVHFRVEDKIPLLRLEMAHMGIPLPDQTILLEDLLPDQKVRLVYKIPILMDRIRLSLSSPQNAGIADLTVIKHQDQVINLARKIMSGERHQGGVTFDCLP